MYTGEPNRALDHYHNLDDIREIRNIKNKSILNDNDRILLLDSEGKFRFIYSTISYLKTIFGVGGSTFFSGSLDEIIIENRAWSAQEVKHKYNEYRGFTAIM